MKPKTLVLLAVAGGCGLIAMFCVQQAMQFAQAGPKIETKRVLVALENIETGAVITPHRVTFKELPADSLPPDEELITTEEEFADRGARVPLFMNDVITLSKLTEPGGTGNSMKIPKGMRVITIPVNEANTASNLLSPGDRVDVLVTYQSRTGNRTITKMKTLLEYVEVFATNAKTSDEIQNDDKVGRTNHVSLLLKPEQVNYVKLADSKGTLSLSWRHKLDDEFVQIRDIDEELFEELQGTIGINEMNPLYGDPNGYAFNSPLFQDPEFSVDEDEPEDIAEFVSSAADDEDADLLKPAPLPKPEPQFRPNPNEIVEARNSPKWTVQIYNGNVATQSQFDIETAATHDAAATSLGLPADANPLAEKMRSLFGGP